MHDLFADWYRAGALEPVAEALELRWVAVTALTEKVTPALVSSLVRLAHQHEVSSEELAAVQAPFKDKDATFAMRGNARELSVLAAAALIHLMRERSSSATFGAYAVLSSSWLHGAPVVEDLTDVAGHYVAAQGARLRSGLGGDGDWTERMNGLMGKAAWEGSYAWDLKPLRTIITTIVRDVDNALRASEEQADLMWWLLSAAPHEKDTPAAVVVAGARQLAALVRDLPGPPATGELLRHHLAFYEVDAENELLGEIVVLCREPDVPADLRPFLPLKAAAPNLPESTVDQLMDQVHREELILRAWQQSLPQEGAAK